MGAATMSRSVVLVIACTLGLATSAAAGAAQASEGATGRAGIRLLAEGNVNDWSPDGRYLAMSRQAGPGRAFEAFLIRPDGSIVKNLNTRVGPTDPPPECDRGNAHFDPSGRFLVMSVGSPEAGCPNYFADPGMGAWTNLWTYELETGKWTNLTNYSAGPGKGIYGTLYPNFSRDGTKLVWAKLLAPADLLNVFGRWEVHVADFSAVGGPHLENDRAFTPGNASFYEPFGFTPDNRRVLMSANIGLPSLTTLLGVDLWFFDPVTGELANWSGSPDLYDEHARISPDGTRLAWGSSGEVKVRKLDKSDAPVRLTFFNALGYPEFSPVTWGWAMAWSPDGTQLVVTQQFPLEARNRAWIVTLGP